MADTKRIKMATSLDQLRACGTLVVADTGDFEAIAKFKPRDATTNPSLILAAAKMEQYSSIVDKAISDAKSGATVEEQVGCCDDVVRLCSGMFSWCEEKLFMKQGVAGHWSWSPSVHMYSPGHVSRTSRDQWP